VPDASAHWKPVWWQLLLVVLVIALTLSLRLPQLNRRPMHADEAVQAAIFRDLWLHGEYRYDPDEFHGPTLSYFTLPLFWVRGPKTFAECEAADFRVVSVIVGTATVLLMLAFASFLRSGAALAAMFWMAISLTGVFYHRYYIHETLFVFFTMAGIAAAWRYVRTGRLVWCLTAGMACGLMQATKETSVLVFFSMAVASLATWMWPKANRQTRTEAGSTIRPSHVLLASMLALLVAGLFLSSWGANPRGLLDGVLTYLPWLKRAGGESPHMQPWYYFLQLLSGWPKQGGQLWTEAGILVLAAVGSLAILRTRHKQSENFDRPFARWILCFTCVLLVIYSVIPYKTPWCVLGPFTALTLLAGIGSAVLWQLSGRWSFRSVLLILFLLLASQLSWQAYEGNFVAFADPSQPHVYAHTSAKIQRLSDDLHQLQLAVPDGEEIPVKVLWQGPYYWPLPWYLRRFELVGYWTELPPDPAAPIVIASPAYDAQLIQDLDATHLMTGFYEIRPQVLAELWVRLDLWESHLRRLGRL
jgi:uncharacterized protein (TIGR03663 family)